MWPVWERQEWVTMLIEDGFLIGWHLPRVSRHLSSPFLLSKTTRLSGLFCCLDSKPWQDKRNASFEFFWTKTHPALPLLRATIKNQVLGFCRFGDISRLALTQKSGDTAQTSANALITGTHTLSLLKLWLTLLITKRKPFQQIFMSLAYSPTTIVCSL